MKTTDPTPTLWGRYVHKNVQLFDWIARHIGKPLTNPTLWIWVLGILLALLAISNINLIISGAATGDSSRVTNAVSDLVLNVFAVGYLWLLRSQMARTEQLRSGIRTVGALSNDLQSQLDKARERELSAARAEIGFEQATEHLNRTTEKDSTK